MFDKLFTYASSERLILFESNQVSLIRSLVDGLMMAAEIFPKSKGFGRTQNDSGSLGILYFDYNR